MASPARRLATLPVLLALALQAPPSPAQAPATPAQRPYFAPVIVGGMTFPVARSGWRSVIEFQDDWHDPRFRLIDGRWQLVGFHEGVDIVAEEGTPVLSASAGTVERTGWTFYSGTRVGVRGDDGRYYFYAHLSRIQPGIEPGRRVETGARLGDVGNTGYGPPGRTDEFPPHLHFGILADDWINPFPLVSEWYRRAAAVTQRAERSLEELTGPARRRVVDSLYGEAA